MRRRRRLRKFRFSLVIRNCCRDFRAWFNSGMRELAIALAAFLLFYHQATSWIPLFPWNDVEKISRKEILAETAFNGVLMGTGLVCLIIGHAGFTHWYPLIYYPFLFVGECVDWWIPYFSESFARGRKIWDYEARYARTVKFIPHKPGKRTPDANHTVLHIATVLTIMAVYLAR